MAHTVYAHAIAHSEFYIHPETLIQDADPGRVECSGGVLMALYMQAVVHVSQKIRTEFLPITPSFASVYCLVFIALAKVFNQPS